MRLSTYTDYGLRTLMYLTTLPAEQLVSVAEVSRVYKISQNHIVKVVGQLNKLGYIQAIRGKNGGICLARDPKDINIGQVIRQLEKYLDGVDCSTSACQLAQYCELKKALAIAMESFITTMETYTLSDLVVNRKQLALLLEN